MTRMISFYLLVGIIVVCGIFFFRVMAGFFLPLFLAAILVVIFRPLHRWISGKCKNRVRLAAALTTLAISLIVLVPLVWIGSLAVSEGVQLVTQFDAKRAKEKLAAFREKYKLEMPAGGDQFQGIQDGLARMAEAADSDNPLSSDQREGRVRSLIEKARQLQSILVDQSPELDGQPDEDQTAGSQPQPETTAGQVLIDALDDALNSTLSGTNQQFQGNLDQAQLAFRNLQRQTFGGPFRAWLINVVNPSDETLINMRSEAFGWLQRWLLSVTGTGAAFVGDAFLDLAIMIVCVYYFLADGANMTRALMRLSPLDDRYEQELLAEFDTISRAVVLATLLTAVAQGLLAGIGYRIFQLDNVFLLMVLTMVFALIPFIGAAAVWAPVCLWLFFYEGREFAAIALTIYGAGIVSMADNVIKPMVLHGQSKLHPLLALLSVIGGVQALGPIGILVGPMVVTFLQALLNMLNSELTALAQTPPASSDSS